MRFFYGSVAGSIALKPKYLFNYASEDEFEFENPRRKPYIIAAFDVNRAKYTF